MSIFGESHRRPAWASRARLGLAGVALALLAACGGGDPAVEFVPQRILALGDEASVITADGRKYTVNAFKANSTTEIDCTANPIWIQYVSTSFGIVFPQCNPNAVAAPTGRILAQPGAKVIDFTAQVDAQLAAGGFLATDLVTVMVGANDVLEQYRRFPTVGEAEVTAAVEAAGAALAQQVNRIANAGGKVVLAKVLDLGQTPFALAQKAAFTDVDRAALLTRLSARFNARLRVGILNDGRKIGLVQSDERLQLAVRFPASFGFVNVTQAACLASVSAPNCTTQTLASDASGAAASANGWLWADSLNPSAGGHLRLGEIAESVARNNPF
jgi:outer membrane lipase/esterase